MSTLSMTDLQVGALHDLALAYKACGFDISPATHSSLDVTVYTTGPEGAYFVAGAFSVSVGGTVRSRDEAVAA